MAGFVLFGTEGCHLCEEAEHLLFQAGMLFAKCDIIDDEALQQRYALRIPVLRHANGQELDWPFDTERLQAFAAQAADR